jgi:beta-glucosidase-like glycosyl hydrolase
MAIQNAVPPGVVSTMCVCNGLNFTNACANPTMLGKRLREELSFQCFVISNFGALYAGEEVAAANS